LYFTSKFGFTSCTRWISIIPVNRSHTSSGSDC
jgi:hypothetical protein